MDLILARKDFNRDGIFSELSDSNGRVIAVTLEHAYGVPHNYSPKIPNKMSVYLCVRGVHRLKYSKQCFETFEVTQVEGHTDILFHIGNFNRDSEGCILLGEHVMPSPIAKWISNSGATFKRFMNLQKGINSFYLNVLPY